MQAPDTMSWLCTLQISIDPVYQTVGDTAVSVADTLISASPP
jgi:hypothetical protein